MSSSEYSLQPSVLQKNTFMRISSLNFVHLPKAWLWAHIQSFSLKFSSWMQVLILCTFAGLFWRAHKTIVLQYRVYPLKYEHSLYLVLFCCDLVLLDFAHIAHAHFTGNLSFASVPVKLLWRIWDNRSPQSTESYWYNHNKTKLNKIVCIFCDDVVC